MRDRLHLKWIGDDHASNVRLNTRTTLNWRLKENAKADVRQTIREEYDELPEVYDRHLWEDKGERTFQFMFERYPGEITGPPA